MLEILENYIVYKLVLDKNTWNHKISCVRLEYKCMQKILL